MTTVDTKELVGVLEPLIRRVVREELAWLVTREPDTFYLDPNSPLYKDMEEILCRKESGELEFYSHVEVWGGE